MKWIAALLVTLGMGALGICEARKLHVKVRRLSMLSADALRIEREMEWEAPTAEKLFRRLKSDVFQKAAEALSAGESPKNAMQWAATTLSLEEKEALLDYVYLLSEENPAGQVQGARVLAKRLLAIERTARENEKRLAKTYALSGFLIGSFVSLLLL